MLATKITPTVSANADRDLAADIQRRVKPPSLLLAEQNLLELRKERAVLDARRTVAISELAGSDGFDRWGLERKVREADQAFAEHQRLVDDARARLAEARSQWRPDFFAALQPHYKAAFDVIEAALSEIRVALEKLNAIDVAAARNGFTDAGLRNRALTRISGDIYS